MEDKRDVLSVGFIKTRKQEKTMKEMADVIYKKLPMGVTEKPRILFDTGVDNDIDRNSINVLLMHLVCPKVKYLMIRRLKDLTPDMDEARHFAESMEKLGVKVIVLQDEMKQFLSERIDDSITVIKETPFTPGEKVRA